MALTVGIAGITGKVSICVAEELLKHRNVLVRGYCRNPKRLPLSLKENPHVSITQGEVDDISALRSFVKGCDVIVCGYFAKDDVMLEGQKLLIDLSEEEGVKRYVASDYTIEFPKLTLGQFKGKDFTLRIKDYLDSKKVKGVHVLVGVFMETFFSPQMGLWKQDENKICYYGTGDEVWDLTTYRTAGQYVAHVVLDREASGFFRFLGDRKSTHQIVAEFKSVYGVEPAVEKISSLEDLAQQAQLADDQYNLPAGLYLILSGFLSLEGELDNAKYPSVKPTTLRQFLENHPMSELSQAADKVTVY